MSRRERELLFNNLRSCGEYHHCRVNQRALVVVSCGILEVNHQVVRKKLSLLLGCGIVSSNSKQEVISKARPRMAFVLVVNNLAVTLAVARLVSNTSLYVVHKNISCSCGAVVIEIVVPVVFVLRQVVHSYCLENNHLLLRGEVKHLLGYAASIVGILGNEVFEGNYANLIFGDSEDETRYEQRLVEREHSIVDGHVKSRPLVAHSYCRMTIEAVHLLMWRAGEQADF